MVCEGAEVRGLFILSKWQIFIVVSWTTTKNWFQSPVLRNETCDSKLWEMNVVFTQDFERFSCSISTASVMWRETTFPCCELAHGVWCHLHPGAAGPVQLLQLWLHSWNWDERHSEVGRYLVFGLEKGWKETFVTWINFCQFSPLFWSPSLEFFSSFWDNVLTRQHMALINMFLSFNGKCIWLFT